MNDWRWGTVSLFLTVILFGCRERSHVEVEQSWQDQVAAVRAGKTQRIEVTSATIRDDDLAPLSDLTELRELLLDHSELTETGVRRLASLPALAHLRLRGTKVTDAGLQQLCKLQTLRFLNLPDADLTDEGLKALSSVPRLELLRFRSPRVTADGIAVLGTLISLRWLHLIDVPVTDEGLQHFLKLKNLESLYLDGAQVTDTGYEKFFQACPHLHIHIDQTHHDRDPQRQTHDH